MAERQEVKWNLPWGPEHQTSHQSTSQASEHPSTTHPTTEPDRSFVRRSSHAVTRRLSDAFALLQGKNDNDDTEDTDSEDDENMTAEMREAHARRRSSAGRQPCGHSTEKATEYSQVGRRSICIEEPTPKPRRKRDRTVAGPSKERKRKSTKPRRPEDGEGQPRRRPQGYRHSHVPTTNLNAISFNHDASEAVYAQSVDKDAIKRIGKLPEGRTFRQPMPFTVPPPIRSQ